MHRARSGVLMRVGYHAGERLKQQSMEVHHVVFTENLDNLLACLHKQMFQMS